MLRSLAIFFPLALALPAPAAEYSRREILDAIRLVESGGREDPPDGDDGRAIGPYQIFRSYWQDALEHDPSIGGTYEDCRDRRYAEKVIRAYMRRHAPAAWKSADAETIARIHNGGPRGHEIAATLEYWERVRRVLSALKSSRGRRR